MERMIRTGKRYSSPWNGREQSEREKLEKEFLAFFVLAVETTDDAEELWAYERLKDTYTASVISDDHAGFFAAMAWAAGVTPQGAPTS